VAAAALLCDFKVVQSFAPSRLHSCGGQVLHLGGRLTFFAAVLVFALQDARIPVREPRIVACPAPNRDEHSYSYSP